MVDTKDILRKAAEDVASGMWCRGEYFATGVAADRSAVESDGFGPTHLFAGDFESAATSYRCAEGSLAFVTWQLGGTEGDYTAALGAVTQRLETDGPKPDGHPLFLHELNDDHLSDDPFEAGQQLAELFRQTADAL